MALTWLHRLLTLAVLAGSAFLPVVAWQAYWVLGLFAAFCFWPSLAVVAWHCWSTRTWPLLVGGPQIQLWGGRTFPRTSSSV